MDSVTQALLGATAAQVGFRQKIGRDATWVAAAAAYAPDLDIFVPRIAGWLGHVDPFMSLTTHRALTHSLLMIPAIALLFAAGWALARGAWRKFRLRKLPPSRPADRPPPTSFGWLLACCLVAVATHAPLDWMTSYGTQLLAPITNQRYALHAVGVIDLIYTPILILTLLACWLVRRWRSESKRITIAIGAAGLVLSSAYLAAGLGLRFRAIDKALALHQPDEVISVEAYPTIGTILLWRTVIETDEAWIVTRIHHLDNNPPRFSVLAKAPYRPQLDLARQTYAYQVYNWFAADKLRVEYDRAGDATIVRFHDMRYSAGSDSGQSLWPLEVHIDPDGLVASARRSHARR
ncbi:MAG: metal-dependent hydrolase, partial [Planctomycetota bacterium]